MATTKDGKPVADTVEEDEGTTEKKGAFGRFMQKVKDTKERKKHSLVNRFYGVEDNEEVVDPTTLKQNVTRVGRGVRPIIRVVDAVLAVHEWIRPPISIVATLVYVILLFKGWVVSTLLFTAIAWMTRNFILTQGFYNKLGLNKAFGDVQVYGDDANDVFGYYDTNPDDPTDSSRTILNRVGVKAQHILGKLAAKLELFEGIQTTKDQPRAIRVFVALVILFLVSIFMSGIVMVYIAGAGLGFGIFLFDLVDNYLEEQKKLKTGGTTAAASTTSKKAETTSTSTSTAKAVPVVSTSVPASVSVPNATTPTGDAKPASYGTPTAATAPAPSTPTAANKASHSALSALAAAATTAAHTATAAHAAASASPPPAPSTPTATTTAAAPAATTTPTAAATPSASSPPAARRTPDRESPHTPGDASGGEFVMVGQEETATHASASSEGARPPAPAVDPEAVAFGQQYSIVPSEYPQLDSWKGAMLGGSVTDMTPGVLILTKSFLIFQPADKKKAYTKTPLAAISSVAKAKAIAFLPGSGRSLEVFVSGVEAPQKYELVARDSAHTAIEGQVAAVKKTA